MIVFDIDGPLIDENSIELFRYAAEGHGGEKWDYSILAHTGDWIAATGGWKKEKIAELWTQFRLSKQFPGEVPTPGAQVALRALEPYPKAIATSRPEKISTHTQATLHEHFGSSFHELGFDLMEDKAHFVNRIGGKWFVEDNMKNAKFAAERTQATVILFPLRGRKHSPALTGLIRLEAEKLIEPDMPNETWDKACKLAWEEIVTLIAS